jgi:hypothetical protein
MLLTIDNTNYFLSLIDDTLEVSKDTGVSVNGLKLFKNIYNTINHRKNVDLIIDNGREHKIIIYLINRYIDANKKDITVYKNHATTVINITDKI